MWACAYMCVMCMYVHCVCVWCACACVGVRACVGVCECVCAYFLHEGLFCIKHNLFNFHIVLYSKVVVVIENLVQM